MMSVVKKRVLFLCTGNSCRSQMAEGWLRHLAGNRYTVVSAGTAPGMLHPHAVEAMREIGIDISHQHAKHVGIFGSQRFDAIITVCDRAKETCPIVPAAGLTLHWSFEDPAEAQGSAEERRAAFRRIRDDIGAHIRRFIEADQPLLPLLAR